jgi:hypothetical protein
VPPFASQALADFSGSHPCPLQEFWPLQELFAVLQAPIPLQELMPAQWTGLAAFLASAGLIAAPLMAMETAATASEAPDTILTFISFPLQICSQGERVEGFG